LHAAFIRKNNIETDGSEPLLNYPPEEEDFWQGCYETGKGSRDGTNPGLVEERYSAEVIPLCMTFSDFVVNDLQ